LLFGGGLIFLAFQYKDLRQQSVRVNVSRIELNGATNVALCFRQIARVVQCERVPVENAWIRLATGDSFLNKATASLVFF